VWLPGGTGPGKSGPWPFRRSHIKFYGPLPPFFFRHFVASFKGFLLHAERRHSRLWATLAVVLLGALLACVGAGAASEKSASAITISLEVAPKAPVNPGDSVAFTAQVAGAPNTAVIWAVDDIIGGNATVGTLSGSGVNATYKAPQAAGSHTVKATSQVDTSKSASAVVTVLAPPPVSVSLSPGATTLAPGATLAFTALVANAANTAITWSVDDLTGGNATVGTLTGTGTSITYTAPSGAGSHTVKATSLADPTKSASAVVTVLAPTQVSIALSPGATTLTTGASLAFTVTVTNASNSAVTWTVDDITGGNATVGTLTGSGASVTYTAPPAAGSHTVKATSQADTSKSASAVVTVLAPAQVTVALSPGATTLAPGASLAFSATVANAASTAITWTVDDLAGGNATVGTLTGTGASVTYTAPQAAGSHTVKATSQADPTKSASSVVTIQAPAQVLISLSPGATSLAPGGSVGFTATVTNTANTAITWAVDGITGGNASVGALTGNGASVTYTAPQAAGSHTVKATSQADPTKSASSTVTVTAPSSITSVVVSPGTLSLGAGAQGRFTATVSGTGTYNPAVTWSAQRGSITSAGLYTAPATSGSDVVTATSVQDPSRTGAAAITVTSTEPPPPTITGVTINPATWSLGPGEQRQFTAAVTGTGSFNANLTWSTGRGSIDGSGLYTAPGTTGSDVVTATSVADTSKFSAAAISVQTGCAPAPTSATVLNVRNAPYSAKGDGVADDTAAIQAAVNAAIGTGGTVLIPDGTYLINALALGGSGIRLGSNLTLKLSPATILKAIPNSATNYGILTVSNASRVTIVGGTLVGDRAAHSGTSGEWGMGLSITHSDQVVVDGVTVRDCWGDGFYVGSLSTNVTLCNVVADHNRRDGLSVTSVDGLVVKGSTFKNTAGTLPEIGINLEPNRGETVNGVLITGCTLTNNAGGALQCGTPFVGSAFGTNITFDQNLVSGNGVSPSGGGYREALNITVFDGVRITNNQILDNTGEGIRLTDQATHTTVRGNTVKGTRRVPGFEYWTGVGILLSTCGGSVVTENTVTGNAGPGIWQLIADSTVIISNNTVSGNGSN